MQHGLNPQPASLRREEVKSQLYSIAHLSLFGRLDWAGTIRNRVNMALPVKSTSQQKPRTSSHEEPSGGIVIPISFSRRPNGGTLSLIRRPPLRSTGFVQRPRNSQYHVPSKQQKDPGHGSSLANTGDDDDTDSDGVGEGSDEESLPDNSPDPTKDRSRTRHSKRLEKKEYAAGRATQKRKWGREDILVMLAPSRKTYSYDARGTVCAIDPLQTCQD